MCTLARQPQDTKALRNALGSYVTGVAIVTAVLDSGLPIGMTINSFCSLSLEPALVAWSIDRSAASFRLFACCSHFTISVLTLDQRELAQRFATRGADKFSDIEIEGQVEPVIPGAAAWFRCRLYRQVPLGDHLMMVGQVEDFAKREAQPLVFAGGEFGHFQTADSPELLQSVRVVA